MNKPTITPERMEEIRRAWASARVAPLWEQGVHTTGRETPRGHHWRWSELRPMLDDAIAITTVEQAERRVLCLVNPDAKGGRNTVTNLNANLQVLMPGETARPHRHTASALRFVIEGEGGITTVDGKECAMAPGDLIITPGMSWHEHTHRGQGPMIWLDALDVALHTYLGTQRFEPGPSNLMPTTVSDKAFAGAGLVPVLGEEVRSYSPLFRYSRAAWQAALAAAPAGLDGARRVRFVNPTTGGPAMALIDCGMLAFDKGQATRKFRTTAHAVALVVSGHGRSIVGNETFQWSPNDVFTMPNDNWISHETLSEQAVLFIVSDRDAMQRLGLLVEEHDGGGASKGVIA